MATDIDSPFNATGSAATVGTLNVHEVNVDSMSAWYPTVNENGDLTWKVGNTSDAAPEAVNIMGPAGAAGPAGPAGPAGAKGAKGDTGSGYTMSVDGNTLKIFF